MGVAGSLSHVVSACPSFSHSSSASAWGPSHGRLLHKLLQFDCNLPQVAVTLKQPAPAWVHHRVPSPTSQPAPAQAPLFTGPHPARCLIQAPQGDTSFFGCIHLLSSRVLNGQRGSIYSTMEPPRAAGAQLSRHGLHHRLQWNLCSSPWSTSSFSFFPELGVCIWFLSYILLPLSSRCCLAVFNPFLNVIPEALARHGLVVVLEPAGIGFVEHGGSLSRKPLLQSHHCQSFPCKLNAITQNHSNYYLLNIRYSNTLLDQVHGYESFSKLKIRQSEIAIIWF